jgi:hypothetical protein
MDKKIIEKIIEAGNHAPSGSNSQPWKFIAKDNIIQVITLPEKDHKVFNFRNRGTHIAHGALMENIEIASRFFGYEPRFELFPQKHISTAVTLSPSKEAKTSDLYDSIFQRHTNRKPYKKEPLLQKEKDYLFQESNKFTQCELIIIEEEKIYQAAKNLAFDILINLQNEVLHKLLFQEIIWKEEDQKHRHGLYIKTMEATPSKAFVFNLLKNWKVAKFFNKIKLLQKIYQESTKTNSSAALIGAIVVEDHDDNFTQAGRLMENIWLRTSKLGLNFHLMTGVLFLWQQANFGEKSIFSEDEKSIINKAYKNLGEIFNVKNKTIALTFRIGKADKPLAVSYKRPPEITWE